MKQVYGIVTSDLEIIGNLETASSLFLLRGDAITEMKRLIETEQEITLSPMDDECINDYSQYITNNERWAYTIVMFDMDM